MVLAAAVIVGIVVEAAQLTTWRILKADREAELLFRGLAYRNAVKSYYEAGTTVKTFPRSLDDLLKDPRFPDRRHIRALYQDPMAKDEKAEWRVIRALDGGISGVAGSSSDEPLKQANFPKELETLAGTRSYSEWVFEYRPPATSVQPKVPASSNPPARPPTLKTF